MLIKRPDNRFLLDGEVGEKRHPGCMELQIHVNLSFGTQHPAFKSVDKPSHNLEVDEFLLGQTTLSKIHPFLVNGEVTPSFEVAVGEVLHFLRALCATIENENTFIV